jgi:hypothetical protein
MAPQGRCLSARERRIVAALADTMAAPEPPLPPVGRTDAVDAVDAWLARAPALNRFGLRAGLLLAGRGRFADRDRGARTRALRRLERVGPLKDLVRVLAGIILIAYYGDDGVSRALGYDADANLDRARRLVAQEARVG